MVRDLAWARFLATLGMSLERTSDMTLPNMLEIHKQGKRDDDYRKLVASLEPIPVDERQSNIEKALKEIALKERRRVREAEFAKLSDEEQERVVAWQNDPDHKVSDRSVRLLLGLR